MSMYEVTLLRASWSPTSDDPESVPVAVADDVAARRRRVDARLQEGPTCRDGDPEHRQNEDADPVRAQNAQVIAQFHVVPSVPRTLPPVSRNLQVSALGAIVRIELDGLSDADAEAVRNAWRDARAPTPDPDDEDVVVGSVGHPGR